MLLTFVTFASCDVQTVQLPALGCVSVDHTLVGSTSYDIAFENVALPADGLLCTQSDVL